MNIRKNVITKKGLKLFFDGYRSLIGVENNNAIFLNSIPKSGTHLAHQFIINLKFNDRYGFFASTPSWNMKLQESKKAKKYLSKQLSRELISGHLFYSNEMEIFLKKQSIPTIFIFRDPRAVFMSELNYLSNMNRWHRCNKYYIRCETFEEKFDLCLQGISKNNFYYPKFVKRISDYIGWISSDHVFKLRFEDIADGSKKLMIAEQLKFYIQKFMDFPSDNVLDLMDKSLSPKHSHTFSGLPSDRWRKDLTKSQISRLNHQLGSLITDMGYEL